MEENPNTHYGSDRQAMNRKRRAKIAAETIEILERGNYRAVTGELVQIASMLEDAVTRTRLYMPKDFDALRWAGDGLDKNKKNAKIEITNETTLEAAHRLVQKHGEQRTLCLNFASAKYPGGGFLNGSQAQEESLARSSGLYAALSSQMAYYEANRNCRTALYTDHIILSPGVPVFRGDDADLMSQPYRVGILSAPAVNANAVRKSEPERASLIASTMTARMKKLLTVAAINGYQHLVLGAWGCGVFGNDPAEVASLFSAELTGSSPFATAFHNIIFAVLDGSPEQSVIVAFRAQFEHTSKN